MIRFCTPGTASSGISTPRSPRATITRVGELHDPVEVLQRLRLLDLCHDAGAALHDLARLGDVIRALDERKRHPVDLGGERRVEVAPVLLGQRAGAEHGVGQADALAVGELAALLDLGDGAPRLDLLHPEAHAPVVQEDRVAGLERRQDLGMRKLHALVVARRSVAVEHEGLALFELDGLPVESADAELRALQVGQDADRPVVARLDLRIASTSPRIASCEVWLMLMRKISAPARKSWSIVSGVFEEGPRVARILILRLRLIGPRHLGSSAP